MSKQLVNVRMTKEANRILAQWKNLYGGMNKSETTKRAQNELVRLERYGHKYRDRDLESDYECEI